MKEKYRNLVHNVVDWCQHNHLQLNARKTNEIVVNFWKKKFPTVPVSI